MTLLDQWKPSDDLSDEISETSNQENNENWVPLSLPLLQGQITHKTAVSNPQNHTASEGTLETNDNKVITDRDILIESDIQNSCIKHHNVEFQIISINAAENPNQSEIQNSDIRQLKSQLAGELNQSESNTAGYSATSAPELWRSGQERRPSSRFNNSLQNHHKCLQIIMLLQVDVHMLRHDSKNYKEAKSRSDWSLFHTALDYKMNSINENEIWIKVCIEDVSSEWSIFTGKWVYKTKWNWNGAVLKHKI